MKLEEKNVLVTGAGGFIGSHLVERLANLNNQVKCFVRYNSRNDWGLIDKLSEEIKDKLEVIPGDLKDGNFLKIIVKDVDVIFHLGAIIAIPYSYLHPKETFETNILGTLNVLTAAKENNVEKIVHTSTSEVYGTAQYVPIDEKHPLCGQSPYSASKIGADKIAESFYLSYGLPIAIIRPFNTFGPRQSSRAVIPAIITQALINDRISLGSTHPTRDFTYVTDTVDGFIKIAESTKSIGEVINTGSNYEISIRDLANKIISLIDREVRLDFDPNRIRPSKSEVDRLWADNTKAKKLIGWEPKISLDQGLKNTIKWISENIKQYKVDIYNI
jgi:NAD dependent epimerase/dehydratase